MNKAYIAGTNALAPSAPMLLLETFKMDIAPLSWKYFPEMNAANIKAPETPRCLPLKSASVIVASRVTGGASLLSIPSRYRSPDQDNLDNALLSQ